MSQLWRLLPAEWAHAWAPVAVTAYSELFPCENKVWQPFQWKGLHFENRLGLAGGVDKNGDQLLAWKKLGFGFAEIGTVTPRPQAPNPGKIISRDWSRRLLWNKMGFPGDGAKEARLCLQNFGAREGFPIFANIGRNRDTPNERGLDDYAACTKELEGVCDAFVINVSSPNTKGLRDLQEKSALRKLVEAVEKASRGKPVLVKFSPDENPKSLQDSLSAAHDGGAQGFVLTNTTLSRPPDCQFPETGGLSGAFLAELSKRSLLIALDHFAKLPERPLLVSVGGVLSASDVQERLDLGADLVQVYSALVLEGPQFPKQVAKWMQTQKGSNAP